ncbi:hypothetical protein JCM19274_5648 [Algibacter lectus]|uniref:Uncharacterized protein n=1 Tax=Algibacter lectus TaxID=221126 RepID=A0A090WLJ7_9FLAO|nr:hypothetical protein JCM19274_5648 [Algibacter lectus]
MLEIVALLELFCVVATISTQKSDFGKPAHWGGTPLQTTC